MTVFFSVGCFFPTVMLTVFDIICGTVLGAFGRVNNQAINTLQSSLQILRCP
jgi:hypothetical protein